MNIFGCFFKHDWMYEPARLVEMRRQYHIGDVPVRDPIDISMERQHRTCSRCNVTQDTEVKEY